jgi:anthranilate synthase component II
MRHCLASKSLVGSGRLCFYPRVNVLFIENNDSFSWNVVDRLPVDRMRVEVRKGADVVRDPGFLERADVVVVGPGPTDPVRAGIVDVILAAARARKPLLGICLGHQALGVAYGARVVRVRPVHGRRSPIRFSRSRLFPSFVGEETVMRYHSLALEDIRDPLRVIAKTDEGIAMAIEHATLPMAGLQFHPDSFGTPRGQEMIEDFFLSVKSNNAVSKKTVSR